MVKTNELYKCSVCGNIVEVVRVGGGELVCCGKPMNLLEAGVTEASTEKHIPVIERIDGGYLVKVGSVAHPMLPEHYIEFIEIMTSDGKIGRKYLKPGDAPEAEFCIAGAKNVYAREFCNLPGHWRADA